MIKRSEDLKTPFLLISILLFIFIMPFISSAPPFTPQLQGQYSVVYPQIFFIQQNQNQVFEFHVNNFSDGILLTNSSISCRFHLYNKSGTIFEINNIKNMDSNLIDWKITVLKGNFTNTGQMGYLFACNSSAFSGEASVSLLVTTTGEELTPSESILYFLITLFAFGLFFLVCWIFLNINGENPRDETGYIGITYRKYVKTALFPLVYVSFLWFFNFIIGLSNNYLGLTLYANTLGFIFLILTKLTLPVVIVTLLIELVLMVKDGNIEKEYKSLWSQY